MKGRGDGKNDHDDSAPRDVSIDEYWHQARNAREWQTAQSPKPQHPEITGRAPAVWLSSGAKDGLLV